MHLHLRQQTNPRLTLTAMPRVPLVIQQTKGLPTAKPAHQGTPAIARSRSAQPAKPPAAKPAPKLSKPSLKAGFTTQLTLTHITRKDKK